jgi:hypothetical protein
MITLVALLTLSAALGAEALVKINYTRRWTPPTKWTVPSGNVVGRDVPTAQLLNWWPEDLVWTLGSIGSPAQEVQVALSINSNLAAVPSLNLDLCKPGQCNGLKRLCMKPLPHPLTFLVTPQFFPQVPSSLLMHAST